MMANKTIFFILILSLGLMISCSDSSTGTDPDPDTNDPEEPAEPASTTGTLEVSVTTSGNSTDEDGYTVTLDGDESMSLDPNGTVTFEELEEGSYSVELSGLDEGCTAEGENPRTADIKADQTTSIQFDVVCEVKAPEVEGIIAFTKTVDQNMEIFTMTADGSNQQRLTNNSIHDDFAVISPDGTKIAFSRQDPQSSSFDIWVMDIDGSNKTQLTTNATTDRFPTWSPDGTRIAFETDRDDNFNIYVMDADGSNQTQVTTHTAHDQRPSWSPEGNKIMFISERDGNGSLDIHTINVDGSNVTKLVDAGSDNGINLFDPAWSPDASQVAYQGFASNGAVRLFIIDADGSNLQMITPDGYNSSYQPAWSPDGNYIAFVDLASATEFSAIWIVQPDGSNPFRLTDSQEASCIYPDWGLVAQ